MVMMSPQIATTKPAPADSRTSRTGSTCPSGAPMHRRIGAEAVLRLGDADRHVAEAASSNSSSRRATASGIAMSAAR